MARKNFTAINLDQRKLIIVIKTTISGLSLRKRRQFATKLSLASLFQPSQ